MVDSKPSACESTRDIFKFDRQELGHAVLPHRHAIEDMRLIHRGTVMRHDNECVRSAKDPKISANLRELDSSSAASTSSRTTMAMVRRHDGAN